MKSELFMKNLQQIGNDQDEESQNTSVGDGVSLNVNKPGSQNMC